MSAPKAYTRAQWQSGNDGRSYSALKEPFSELTSFTEIAAPFGFGAELHAPREPPSRLQNSIVA